MAGKRNTSHKLNRTLKFICELLRDMKDWFIGYGTLLGYVRNKSCIEGDDDIDIIINNKYFSQVKEILSKNGFTFVYDKLAKNRQKDFRNKYIIKTNETDQYSSVDFYCANVNDNGDFHDVWEDVVWTNCYVNDTKELEKREWNDTILYLPNDYKNKLEGRYGKKWSIPSNTKGPRPFKKRL